MQFEAVSSYSFTWDVAKVTHLAVCVFENSHWGLLHSAGDWRWTRGEFSLIGRLGWSSFFGLFCFDFSPTVSTVEKEPQGLVTWLARWEMGCQEEGERHWNTCFMWDYRVTNKNGQLSFDFYPRRDWKIATMSAEWWAPSQIGANMGGTTYCWEMFPDLMKL